MDHESRKKDFFMISKQIVRVTKSKKKKQILILLIFMKVTKMSIYTNILAKIGFMSNK